MIDRLEQLKQGVLSGNITLPERKIDLPLEDKPNAKPFLNQASYKNPDRQAEIISLSESNNLPLETVERNFDEVNRKVNFNNLDVSAFPKTNNYLADKKNSQVSIDDTDSLTTLESLSDKEVEA